MEFYGIACNAHGPNKSSYRSRRRPAGFFFFSNTIIISTIIIITKRKLTLPLNVKPITDVRRNAESISGG